MADMPPIAETDGMAQHEMVALVTIAENIDSPSDKVSTYTIKENMNRAGFRKITVTLALTALLRKRMLQDQMETDINGNDFFYSGSRKGMEWLLQNQGRLLLRKQRDEAAPLWQVPDDDAPF